MPLAQRTLKDSVLVVGSGPAGTSAALALLADGHEVTMLDAGLTLEPERRAALISIRSTPQEDWREGGHLHFLKQGMAADLSGVPLKLAYGSDFPYRKLDPRHTVECRDSYLQVSLARGGFSNTWGSSMLPYRQADMQNWPMTQGEMEPHYRAVLKHVPMAGVADQLEQLYPLYTTPFVVRSSRQAEALLTSLAKNASRLRQAGVVGGASRIAIDQSRSPTCVLCGLCMYGCPHELIYTTASTIASLLSHPRFEYIPNVLVTHVKEQNGEVTVSGTEVQTESPFNFRASRVFLGAGAVNTTSILLRSLEAYDQPVTMKDSAYFLQPCLRLAGAGDVRHEPMHSLAQAFLEITDPSVSANTVHLQVYTYNELFEQAIESAFGRLSGIVPKAALLNRLYLVQGFLHSSDSASMSCRLQKTAAGSVFKVQGEPNEQSNHVIKRVQGKLMKIAGQTGLFPVTPMLRRGEPGRSFHVGGTFPMSRSPNAFQSSTLGVPHGFSRVHIVDSSSFPSIAATTITLAAMANAHRIAKGAFSADESIERPGSNPLE